MSKCFVTKHHGRTRHVKVALINPNNHDALCTAFETWAWNFKPSSINTPWFFSVLMLPNTLAAIWYFNLWFELPRWRLLHLSSLNPSCHLCDHLTRLSRSCWMASWSSIFGTARNSFMSSANIVVVLLTTSGRSFIKTTNKMGF